MHNGSGFLDRAFELQKERLGKSHETAPCCCEMLLRDNDQSLFVDTDSWFNTVRAGVTYKLCSRTSALYPCQAGTQTTVFKKMENFLASI